MGTKEKKRSKSRSRSPSSDSTGPERKHKKEKKHSKHKHKHKKHKKHSSPEIDDEKVRAAKALLEQHLKRAGSDAAAAAGGGSKDKEKHRNKGKHEEKVAGSLPPGAPLLGPDDYFERAPEFTAWLQEIRHQYFNELSTEQSHILFKEFAQAWNAGQLPPRFYQGLAAAPLKRTSHNWGFKAKQGAGTGAASVAASGAKLGMAAFLQDQQQQHTESRAAGEAADRRMWRREQKEQLDYLLPKATGGTHEARVEARMARREAARAREDSPDMVPVTGGRGDIMGGGADDSFAAAKAREAKRQEWRSKQSAAKKEELASKLSAAAAAEADKMAQFRALVAAQGGKITIAKRQ